MAAPLKTPHNAPLRVKITQEWIDKAILYAARFARVSKHDDRVYDIAMEALIRCSQTYSEDWGISFKTHLIRKVNRLSIASIEKKNRDANNRQQVLVLRQANRNNRKMNEAMIGCESRDEYDILKREVGHREKQIIELSMRGWKRKAIAKELGMSIEGVRVYEKRIVKRRYDCHKEPCDDRSLIEMHRTRNKSTRKTYA